MRQRRICTGDCETDPFKFGRVPEPFIWGLYDGREFIKFYDTEAFIDYIRHRRLKIYMHNGGKFDFHYLFSGLAAGQQIKIINGRIAKMTVGNSILIDSCLILPLSLSQMQKDKFDYEKMEKEKRWQHIDEIEVYLKHDCEYLYKFVVDFIDRFGDNLTIAGTALKYWKQIKGDVPKSNEQFYHSFSKYYYGGRVEPFQSGTFRGKYTYIDINSAYPAAMLKEHPYGTRFYESKRVLDRDIKKSFVHLRCKSDGALPQRKKGGGIEFPHCYGEFFVTGWEFIAGLETGTISDVTVLKYCVFEETTNFADYILPFYEEKKNAKASGNKSSEIQAKLMMNALYGKFASNYDKYEEYTLTDYGVLPKNFEPEVYEREIEDIEDPELKRRREFELSWKLDGAIADMDLWSRKLLDHKKYWYNIATSASITGCVRAFMWRSICQCNNVLYCDTDSIICGDPGKLKIGKELGEWDYEAHPIQVAIAGKKLYACWNEDGSTKVASKGVRLPAGKIWQVAKGQQVVYDNPIPTYSVKTGIKFQSRRVNKTA